MFETYEKKLIQIISAQHRLKRSTTNKFIKNEKKTMIKKQYKKKL